MLVAVPSKVTRERFSGSILQLKKKNKNQLEKIGPFLTWCSAAEKCTHSYTQSYFLPE